MDRKATADAVAALRAGATHRAATPSLLTLDTVAWCAGFLGAAWTRFEFGPTPVQSVRHLVRSRLRWRHPIGSAGEARDLAGTSALAALVTLAGLLPVTDRPVPASTPLVGTAVALLLMGAARAVWRAHRERRQRPVRGAERCLVYGVDEASERLVRVCRSRSPTRTSPGTS